MCMIDGADDGYCIRLHDRQHKARKEHKCVECRRTIHPGEIYRVERTIFDGSAESYKTCSHCQVVTKWLAAECGGYLYHGVAEDIHEHVEEGGYAFGVKLLDIGMGRGWKRRDGRLWPIPKVPKTSHQLEAEKSRAPTGTIAMSPA